MTLQAIFLHAGHGSAILHPIESHHWFGAVFLFLGVLLVAEAMAGSVWFRSQLRAAVWPAGIIFLGEGLIIVAFLDPLDRVVHLTVGLLVVTAGWLELRHRFGAVSLASANLLVVPALLSSGFEMGVVHGRGTLEGAIGHMIMGATVALMAGVRIYRVRNPQSVRLNLTYGFLVVFLAAILLVFAP